MRFSITAVLALATSLVQAQEPTDGFHPITKPTRGEEVAAGSTYEIVWEPSASYPGTVTIGLLGGASQNTLNLLPDIATGVDGSAGSYSWEVPATLGDLATYGIKISLESDPTVFQYGFPFKIVGGGSGGASSSTTGSATGTESVTETATETSTTATETESTSGSVTKTTSSASSTITIPSSTVTSSTLSGNWSTTAHSTITTLTTGTASTTTRTSTSSIATNGVASLAAGSFAMLGGVAMAVLAI
jgi:hypothetical protein